MILRISSISISGKSNVCFHNTQKQKKIIPEAWYVALKQNKLLIVCIFLKNQFVLLLIFIFKSQNYNIEQEKNNDDGEEQN